MTQYPHNEAHSSTGIVYTFDLNDERARLTWNGRTYRAVRIERDDVHGLSVWLVRTTKKGADFMRLNSFMWLTLANSLDRDPAGAALAAYVREIAEPTAEQVAEIIADSDALLDRLAPVIQCSTEPTRHAPHMWRGAGQHVDNPIRYSCPGYDGCAKCTDPIPHTHTGYHGMAVHDEPVTVRPAGTPAPAYAIPAEPTDALSVATNAIVQAPSSGRAPDDVTDADGRLIVCGGWGAGSHAHDCEVDHDTSK